MKSKYVGLSMHNKKNSEFVIIKYFNLLNIINVREQIY